MYHLYNKPCVTLFDMRVLKNLLNVPKNSVARFFLIDSKRSTKFVILVLREFKFIIFYTFDIGEVHKMSHLSSANHFPGSLIDI